MLEQDLFCSILLVLMITRICILCEIMWYSNTLQFPFQEIYKEYAQISAQKLCLRRFSMQHQNMVWQDIRRWSRQNQNMGLWKHQKNLRSEDKKMLCTKLFDSDDIQILY